MRPQRSLKGRALQWLSQREQSRGELRRKLLPHAVAEDVAAAARASAAAGAAGAAEASESPEAAPEAADESGAPAAELPPAARVEAVLDWLEAHQYLSTARFVESRVHARAARFGNLRIRQELKQHQVALPPETALALGESELQRACAVRGHKFAAWPASSAERGQQARFLAGRGFSPEVIGRALRGRAEPDEDDC